MRCHRRYLSLSTVLALLAPAAVASAGLPVSLPDSEDAAQWSEVARAADLVWVTPSQARVSLTDLGPLWRVSSTTVQSRSLTVAEPTCFAQRLDVAVLARALGREMSTSLDMPTLLTTPPAPMAPALEPVGTSAHVPRSGSAHASTDAMEPSAPERPVDAGSPIPIRVPLVSLDSEEPVPETKTALPSDVTSTVWVRLGTTHRSRGKTAGRLTAGADLISGPWAAFGVAVTTTTQQALPGFGHRPWHDRSLWELGASAVGSVSPHPFVRAEGTFSVVHQSWYQGHRVVQRVAVPQLGVGVEVHSPGVRSLGVHLGATTNLRGVRFNGAGATPKDWLSPVTVNLGVVARIGRPTDPSVPSDTPVRAMPPRTATIALPEDTS